MPPQPNPPRPQYQADLMQPQKSSAGPMIGIIIILVLLIVGALYFWGAHLNAQANPEDQVPYIPADNSTADSQ